MPNQAYDICHTQAGWTAVCDDQLPNGPLSLAQDGKPFLSNLTNAVDDLPLQVIKSRTYRKGGKAVHDNEARVNPQNGTGFRQITRYANNVARITTDVFFKRDTKVKNSIQIGSFQLPGTWTRLTTMPVDGDPSDQPLADGTTLTLNDTPLAWIFTREDGFQVEVSAGFDLWRWNHAFGVTQPLTRITVKKDSLTLQRNLMNVPEDAAEPMAPEPRDYRFCYQIAWTVPNAIQKPVTDAPETIQLDHGSLPADFPTQLSLDFSQLTITDGAKVNGQHDADPCWESKATVAAAKKIIRQLASASDSGWLNITGGLTPSVCHEGKHVDRPRKQTPHWDLNGIICFAEWARQTLGPDWKITCQPQGNWALLPSLQCLFGANGFSVE